MENSGQGLACLGYQACVRLIASPCAALSHTQFGYPG